MSTSLQSKFQLLQQLNPNTSKQYEAALLQVKEYREKIDTEKSKCDEQINSKKKSNGKAFVLWESDKKELAKLEQKSKDLDQLQNNAQKLLILLAEKSVQHKESLEILKELLIEEQQRQEKHELTDSKYGFEILENEAKLNEIEVSHSTIYVAPVNNGASGKSADQYVCKIFDLKGNSTVSFYIETGVDVYDIIRAQVVELQFQERFKLLQEQPKPNTAEECAVARFRVNAYCQEITSELKKEIYQERLDTSSPLAWLRNKNIEELCETLKRLHLETLKSELDQINSLDLIDAYIQKLEQYINLKAELSDTQKEAEELLFAMRGAREIIIEFQLVLAQAANSSEMAEQEDSFLVGAVLKIKNKSVENKVRGIFAELMSEASEVNAIADEYRKKLNGCKSQGEIDSWKIAFSGAIKDVKTTAAQQKLFSDLQQKAKELKNLLEESSKLIAQFQEELESIIIPKDGNKVLEKEAEAQVDRKFNEFFKRITAEISELENAGSNVVLVAELKQLEEEGIQKLNDLREHARKHLNAILDKLQAKLDLITAIENEIEIEKQFDVLTQEINKAIAVNSNQMVLKGLIEFKSQAEESKNAVVKKLKSKKEDELNKKRTFAEYVFKPMPVGGEPELLEKKVIYFSEKDGCLLCQGLDPQGKARYEEKIQHYLESDKKLDDRLSIPVFQRYVLNALVVYGCVSYSVQQDWVFVLSNLRDALNAVKEPIIDRDGSFYKELKKVGIFYNDEKKKYSVNLNEAESSISYRNYICNPDFLIAAAFDDAAAKKYQSESRNLHAEQFKFNVSPEQSPIQNQNLLKAIDEAHEFQRKDRVEKQPVLIEEDRECAKKHLSGEALARLEEARVHIAEAKKQQRILAEACELQEKCVEALTPSVETLEKDEAVLRKQSEFEAQMKALVDEEEQIHIRIAQQLVNFLDQLNDKNDEVHRLNEKIRLEKDVREKIEKAIDTLISAHERFTIEPTFWIWISRSSRSKRLANWLDLIKKDLKDPDVKMSAIRAQIHTAIVSFNDSGDRNTALSEFEKKINALPVLDSESGKMSELLQTQGAISFAESEIMVKDLSELNKKRIADDTKLQELSSKKVELQGKMDELKPQVAAIQERRKQAQIEHDSLRRVKQLRTKSGSQQCLAEDDKVLFSNFLALLQEQKTKKEVPFVSTEDSDEAEQLKLSASVNKIARNRSVHEINMQDVLKQIKSIGESLDRADSEGHSESKSLFSSCVSFFTKAARTTYKNTFDLAHVGENIASPLHMQKSECTPSS